MSLQALLEARIAEHGPISVAEYMEACLLHPDYGYYTTKEPFGAAGDFTTAPEISQIFGELTGAWLANAWEQAGSPSPCILLELGPGRGTLMNDMLRATKSVPAFHSAIQVTLLEASAALAAKQKQTLGTAHHAIRWIASLAELPSLPLFFIANELFDALPIRQFVRNAERCVSYTKGALHFTPEGSVSREMCEAGEALSHLISKHIATHGGAGLIIDYGYTGGTRGDTLQAVKHHAYVDVLSTPGEADITAHVDFDALANASTNAGAQTAPIIPQGAFLRSLGAELRASALCKNADNKTREKILAGLERLVAPQAMGELFKVLRIHHPSLQNL